MNLVTLFFLALFVAFFGTAFLPHMHLMAFAPFLAIVYQRKRFIPSLWISFGCGLIFDLLNADSRIGFYGLVYLITTVLLYRQKRHFFEDKSLALLIFTAAISSVTTLVTYGMLFLFNESPAFSIKLAMTDLVILPIVDALYAFVWFICPMKLYKYVKKVGLKNIFYKQTDE